MFSYYRLIFSYHLHMNSIFCVKGILWHPILCIELQRQNGYHTFQTTLITSHSQYYWRKTVNSVHFSSNTVSSSQMMKHFGVIRVGFQKKNIFYYSCLLLYHLSLSLSLSSLSLVPSLALTFCHPPQWCLWAVRSTHQKMALMHSWKNTVAVIMPPRTVSGRYSSLMCRGNTSKKLLIGMLCWRSVCLSLLSSCNHRCAESHNI